MPRCAGFPRFVRRRFIGFFFTFTTAYNGTDISALLLIDKDFRVGLSDINGGDIQRIVVKIEAQIGYVQSLPFD